nr:hypothetical protein [Nostoc sp. SerVER01]
MRIAVYQDLSMENKHGFSIGHESATENILVVREGVLPGAFGYPSLYTRHLRSCFNNQPLLIISITDYELTDDKRQEIIRDCEQFLLEQN